MRIIKLSGHAGVGKTHALTHLADIYSTTVTHCGDLLNALPLLMKKTSALNVNTFVDNVFPEDIAKLEKLAKLYPDHYRLYLSGESI